MLPPQCPTDAESLTAVSGRLLCCCWVLAGERVAPIALPFSCSHNSVLKKNGERERGTKVSPDRSYRHLILIFIKSILRSFGMIM